MKLKISTSKSYLPEKKYISDVLFREFLGIEFEIDEKGSNQLTIASQDASDNRKLIIHEGLFKTSDSDWLQEVSMPTSPLPVWLPENDNIHIENLPQSVPVIFGKPLAKDSFIRVSNEEIEIGIDIPGSAFFMMTRYEEFVNPDRDLHDRFPIEASLAYREGFTDIPIVNCYLELLWWAISKLWTKLKRREREYRVLVSHDIDDLLGYAWQPFPKLLRSLAVDVVKDRSISNAANRAIVNTSSRLGMVQKGNEFILQKDPFNNLGRIADINRKYGLIGCFNFIAERTESKYDGYYQLSWEWIREILKNLNLKDQEIGIHPSYKTYKDKEQTKHELNTLKNSCNSAGIQQADWGGRQHYLRWSNPQTWQNYEDAGLAYDSSIGYAERPGFRSGVCYEYPVFNLCTRKKLKLRERPLIVMDASVLDYMRGSWGQFKDEAIRFADIVRKYNGDFTLLCHNSRLSKADAMETYEEILRSIRG